MRATQVSILKEVAQFCTEHGIIFYLYAGTLLGAVRHKGYIPWDDDIDLAMPRADYDRFCRIATGTGTVNGYSVYGTATRSDFTWPFTKVADDTTLQIEHTRIELAIGVNIDLFPLDNWPDGRVRAEFHHAKLRVYQVILSSHHLPLRSRTTVKKLPVLMVRRVLRLVPPSYSVRQLTRCATKYLSRDTHFLGVSVWGPPARVSAEAYARSLEMQFEDRTYPVPQGYDEVLTAMYGDYMRPPPPAQQESPHFLEAYRLP